MLDTIRRLIVILMLAVAVIGLMPLIPVVLGYKTATILENTITGGSGSSGGTMTYPATNGATPLVYCEQNPASISLNTGTRTTAGRKYFKCWNNWGSSVTLTWSAPPGSGSGMSATGTTTLPAGAQGLCVPVRLLGSTDLPADTQVEYMGVTNSPTDLYLEIQFTGLVGVDPSFPNNPPQCS